MTDASERPGEHLKVVFFLLVSRGVDALPKNGKRREQTRVGRMPLEHRRSEKERPVEFVPTVGELRNADFSCFDYRSSTERDRGG